MNDEAEKEENCIFNSGCDICLPVFKVLNEN